MVNILSEVSETLLELGMTASETFVSTAEAAFIAEVSDRALNRSVDERILPPSLFESGRVRRVARLGAALTGFYFGTERELAVELRRRLVRDMADRLMVRPDRESLISLKFTAMPDLDLVFDFGATRVDAMSFLERAWRRSLKVDDSRRLIESDPEVLGGIPVFAGSRVPIESILASLKEGVTSERLRAIYPFLTDRHVEAACTYTLVYRRRGRPPRAADRPGLRLLASGALHHGS